MAGISFDVRLPDFVRIRAKRAYGFAKAELALAIQMLTDTDQYVPADTKNLANKARAESKAATDAGDPYLIYPGPQSHYLYKGLMMIDPETNSPWAKKGATKVYTARPLDIKKEVNSKAQKEWFEASKRDNLEKWRRAIARTAEKYGR